MTNLTFSDTVFSATAYNAVIDENAALRETVAELTERVAELEAKSKPKKEGPSKIDQARDIFTLNFGIKTPKEVKELFVQEIGLTKSGASTYYYKFKAASDMHVAVDLQVAADMQVED